MIGSASWQYNNISTPVEPMTSTTSCSFDQKTR